MKTLKELYKTRSLYKNGVFILISLIIFILIGYLFPNKKPEIFSEQIYTLNGFNAKYNDDAEVSDFFLSIKKNNGVLVLGTSETVALAEGNYHDFLNEDPDLRGVKFSVLAGAGRTCGTYIPLFLHHRNDLDSLQLIFFINPAYWRANLCEPDLKYWNRYTQYHICNTIEISKNQAELYFKPVQNYKKPLNIFQKWISQCEYVARDVRRNYFCDLRNLLYPNKYKRQFQFVTDTMSKYASNPKFGNVDTELIDTIWNTERAFHNQQWFQPINETDNYRYMELASFIHLCKELGIKATFVISPYNERFINQYDPSALAGHQRTVEKIRQLLIDEKVGFIDATDISPAAGAFVDHQHHSSYGADLIYLKIKQYLHEEKNN